MRRRNSLIVEFKPKSIVSEAFRTLRTNIQFASLGADAKVILFTSTAMSEGKSTIVSNLATAFAQQGKRVLLIDGDMRRGTQYEIFDVTRSNGLSNYLASVEWDEGSLIKRTFIENLHIITSGNTPPNPSELLSSDRMLDLITQCKEKFDLIIIDAPPCLAVADGLILAKLVDTSIIVAVEKETKKDGLKSTKKALETVGAKIGGVVLNKVKLEQHGRDYKYYRYYSDAKR